MRGGRDQCLLLGARPACYVREEAAASLPYPPTTTAEFALRDHPELLDVRDDVEVPAHRGRPRLSRAAHECFPVFASAQRGDPNGHAPPAPTWRTSGYM